MFEDIHTKNGLTVRARFIKIYRKNGKAYGEERRLWFAQDRIVITDDENQELGSMDMLDYVARTFVWMEG